MAAVIARMILDQPKGDRPICILYAQMKTLAAYRGCHVAAARKQIQGLVQVGVLEEIERGGGRRYFSSGSKRHIGGVAQSVYRSFHADPTGEEP